MIRSFASMTKEANTGSYRKVCDSWYLDDEDSITFA